MAAADTEMEEIKAENEYMAKKKKASHLRHEVRRLKKKLSYREANLKKLSTLIHAEQHHVYQIRDKWSHQVDYWLKKEVGPSPEGAPDPQEPQEVSTIRYHPLPLRDAGSDAGSASSDAASRASSDVAAKM